MDQPQINIKNRRASFEYQFIEKYTAGIQLQGTEIKSLRLGKANISDAYCFFMKSELWVKNLHISEYDKGNIYNHQPLRERKLLLNKHELKKIQKALADQGVTVIPIRIFLSDKGFAKMEIAIAKGKNVHDKREGIKKKDLERESSRKFK